MMCVNDIRPFGQRAAHGEDALLRVEQLVAIAALLQALLQVLQARVEAPWERLGVGGPVLNVGKQRLAAGQDQCREGRIHGERYPPDRPRAPARRHSQAPLLYDLGWDTGWAYWSACQNQPAPDLSRASGFRLYSMVVDAAAQGLGAAIGRSALIADELASGVLIPVLEQQADAPERCCLITTASSRRKPEVQAFRRWILQQAQSAAHPTRAR